MGERDYRSGAATQRLEYTLDLLGRLIAEPSVEGSPAIARCLDIVAEEVAPLAMSIQRPSHDGLESLIARFGSGPAQDCLILSGHVDVVPVDAGWDSPPFTVTQRDGQ